ncbi:hypothetical protein [uncultured Sutterella sp.]|uniref:hypothetical protein n=1 Tax=uncultured Sutterella sp. TaxID=286133 RepID=UPI00259B8417|nr:hypothetical protein [uncultured Sutterella sp.]
MQNKEVEAILSKLPSAVSELECPICHAHQFVPADGFGADAIYDAPTEAIMMVGPFVNAIMLVCENCGFISKHAIGPLVNKKSSAE